MKTLKFLALFCFLATFVACSSDDDKGGSSAIGGEGSGTFSFDGKNYNLKMGLVYNEGTNYSEDGSTEFEITLMTTTFHEVEGNLIPKDEKISILDFTIYSEDGSKPKVGTYDFDDFAFTKNTLEDAELLLDYNWMTDMELGYYYADDGTFTVKKSGNTYELEFEILMNNNKTLTGSYKGKLLEDFYGDEDDYLRPADRNFLQKAKAKMKELR